jgi:membrane associated rhomboid family serine protease
MPYFTYGIIALTVIISLVGFYDYDLYEHNLFSVSEVLKKGHIHRLFTSQFFHVDWSHLLVNMFSFYFFADSIELKYGIVLTALIYFGSGIGGDLFTLILKFKDRNYRAVGASGAVSGIIFASIFLIQGSSIIIFPLPLPIPPWLFAFLFVLGSIYGIGRNNDQIGHEAHLGGALTGVGITLVMYPSVVLSQLTLLIGVVVPIVIFLIIMIVKPDLVHLKKQRPWR